MNNNIIDELKNGISNIESQGSYNAIGKKTHTGDQAYGKYQVMGANIPAWTKEATGTTATPQEFLSNPDLQEKVATHRVGVLYDKYGNPADVASAWFTGGPLKQNANKKDVNNTSDTDYVAKVLKFVTGAKTAEASGSPSSDSNVSTFASKIKAKYPQYADIPDAELTQKILAKYPQYQDLVGGAVTQPKNNTPKTFDDLINSSQTEKKATKQDALSTAGNISKGVLNVTGGNDIADSIAATKVKSDVLAGRNGAVEADYSKLTPEVIAKLKAKGVPTTLEAQRQESANQVEAPSYGKLGADVLRTGSTIGGLILGGGALSALSKGGTALGTDVAQGAISNYLAKGELASSLGAGQKIEALSNALNVANPGEKIILNKAIQELTPSVLKEAGVGSFSELNPKMAKLLGITAKTLKGIIKLGLVGAGIQEGGQIIKGALGQK